MTDEAGTLDDRAGGAQDRDQRLAAVMSALTEAAPFELRGRTLPNAMAEVAAVAESCEEAAHRIVSCVDHIVQAHGAPPDAFAALVRRECMDILEACAFQDICGQRISKIVAMLLLIEDRLGGLEAALGTPSPCDGGAAAPADPEAKGPPLPSDAIAQADVDRLFL
jgi:chemotaxis protein CheZ